MNERKQGRVLTEAERTQARYNLLTTQQVADRLSERDPEGKKNITADTVRQWCKAGWLRCVDGRLPNAGRPYYLIDWPWVEEFVAAGGAAAFVKDDAA